MSRLSENSLITDCCDTCDIVENSSKDLARSKRARRFARHRDSRFGSMRGHTARAPTHGIRNRSSRSRPNTIEKKTVSDSISHRSVRRGAGCFFSGVSPLEESMGFRMCNELTYSLNKRNRWSLLDEALSDAPVSEVRDFPRYHTSNKWHLNQDQAHKVVAFYEDDFKDDHDGTAADMCKAEQLGPAELSSRKFIRDAFWKGMAIRRERRVAHLREREALNYWRNVRDFHPPHVDSPRLAALSLRSTSVSQNTCVRAAKVSSMQYKNVWSPAAFDDTRDFLTADLGENMIVTHVSTKGRFPSLAKNGQPSSREEYVRKYRLFYRLHGRRDWLPLGVFQGNTDRNTEVVHKLVSIHTGKVGIEAAQFRFQPLSKGEGGFKNRKAMRVALYGRPKPVPVSEGVDGSGESGPGKSQKGKSNESHIFDRKATGVFFHVSQVPDDDEANNRFSLYQSTQTKRWWKRRHRVARRRSQNTLARETTAKCRRDTALELGDGDDFSVRYLAADDFPATFCREEESRDMRWW